MTCSLFLDASIKASRIQNINPSNIKNKTIANIERISTFLTQDENNINYLKPREILDIPDIFNFFVSEVQAKSSALDGLFNSIVATTGIIMANDSDVNRDHGNNLCSLSQLNIIGHDFREQVKHLCECAIVTKKLQEALSLRYTPYY
jgi:hypothetical protein